MKDCSARSWLWHFAVVLVVLVVGGCAGSPQDQLISRYNQDVEAAKRDDVNAIKRVAWNHYTGFRAGDDTKGWRYYVDIPRNLELSRTHLIRCADLGDAYCGALAGVMLMSGQGGHPDPERAVKYLRLGADNNIFEAITALGKAYINGQGIKRDVDSGINYLKRSVASNDPMAMDYLVTLYTSKEHPHLRNTKAANELQERADKVRAENKRKIDSINASLENSIKMQNKYGPVAKNALRRARLISVMVTIGIGAIMASYSAPTQQPTTGSPPTAVDLINWGVIKSPYY